MDQAGFLEQLSNENPIVIYHNHYRNGNGKELNDPGFDFLTLMSCLFSNPTVKEAQFSK